MSKLQNLLPFVKGQAAFHRKMSLSQGLTSNPKRQALHRDLADQFGELIDAITEAIETLSSIPAPSSPENNPLELNPEDLAGLPPELLSQLSVTESDKLDGMIVDIIKSSGGSMLLDKLMIALFKRSGEIQQRPQLISRLYRLSKKGKVFSVPKKKGVYTTDRPLESSTDNNESSN